ncbi:MAG: AtpZ/AtpI family protein [Rhodocyclaceae bacterium]|nr:AtpZ/AtpI family protein [Rhodocyclaceae bacterium]
MMEREELQSRTERDLRRLERRERAPAGLIGMLLYGGTTGLLFVVPVVGGAYLGRWLDTLAAGYSVRWTVSGIVLGIVLGAYNAYRYMRRHA